MTVKGRWKSPMSPARATLALGASLTIASAVAASTPAVAASSGGPRLPYGRIAAGQADSGELAGVFCTAARNCWSVGGRTSKGARLNLVLHWTGKFHWNGAKWSSFSTPNPGGTRMDASNVLNAVRCTSAAN